MLGIFKFWFVSIIIVSISLSFAQNKNIPIVEIDDEVINLAEFEKEFVRSNGNKKKNLEEYKEFLDIYLGFKLKLKDAKEKGYEQDPLILKEYEEYKKRVSRTYYQTKFIKSPGLKRYYNQSLLEFRVAHILIKTDTTRNDATALAFSNSIIDSVNNGSDWNKMAEKHSGDERTAANGGDLYYYSGARLGGEFLQILLATDIGQIGSKPVKSRFGYHIVKVLDKKIGIPAVNAKHILIKGIDSAGVFNDDNAKKLCKELHQRVLNGESFETLAKKYSDDKGSGARGGELGFMERGRTVRPFDEILFNTRPGEISEVFKTQFGYHFLKVVEHKKLPTFGEFTKQASKTYDRVYYKQDFITYTDSLFKHYNYNIIEKNLLKIKDTFARIRLTELEKNKNYKSFRDLPLVNYPDKKITFNDIVNKYLSDTRFQNSFVTTEFLKRLVKTQMENDVIEAELKIVESADKEFQKIMNEYKNGLLIFKLQEEEIWKNVKINEEEKLKYYKKHKDSFMWPKRLAIIKINHKDKSYIDSLITIGKAEKVLSKKILEEFSGLTTASDTIIADTDNSISRLVNQIKINEFSKPHRLKDGGWAVVYLEKRFDKMPKTYNESESEISSIILEKKNKAADKKYIEGLKERYEPEYFYENLKQAFK